MPRKCKQRITAPQADFAEQPAGEFSPWLRNVRRAQKLKVLGNDVPCGECIACCRASLFIHIRPEESDTLKHIPKPLLFPAPGLPKGHVLLGFHQKGECPMLKDNKCSIYEHRPRTCRDFDCRVFAATGVTIDGVGPQSEIARRARSWRFSFSSEEDRRQFSAVQTAAAFLQEQRDAFPEGALPHAPVQLAALALEVYEVFYERAQAQSANIAEPDRSEIVRAVLAAMEKLGARARQAKKHYEGSQRPNTPKHHGSIP
jgi:uncharacterized protein